MNSVENYAIRYLEPKDVKDLDQYNALLRYTFQVTEDELTATGWKDEEIKQSKFPVLERADVLGCFDGDTLISQFAVYPLKMNIYGEVFPVGFVTSVCTYPEYTGQGIMKKLMYQSLENMKQQGRSGILNALPRCFDRNRFLRREIGSGFSFGHSTRFDAILGKIRQSVLFSGPLCGKKEAKI